MNNNYNDVLEEKISLIASNPGCGKLEVIINRLYEFGIKKKKKIILFNFDGPSRFYETMLLAKMANVERRVIEGYLNPCLMASKETPKMEGNSFFETLERLKESQIYMCDFVSLPTEPVDYILSYDEERDTDLFIINYFNILVEKSKYSLEEILEKVKKYAEEYNTSVLLVYNQDRKRKIKNKNDLENKEIFESRIQNIRVINSKKEEEKVVFLNEVNYNKKKDGGKNERTKKSNLRNNVKRKIQ